MSLPEPIKKRFRPTQDRRCIKMAIPRSWSGATAVLIAGGPSLTPAQVATAKRAWANGMTYVLGANDAYRIAPWMDGLYAADPHWWDLHIEAVRDTHIPLLFCQDEKTCEKYGLWHTPGEHHDRKNIALSEDPGLIRFGAHSGYQLLNIVFLMGCKRILLLGYDCKIVSPQKKHWFGNHSGVMDRTPDYNKWASFYDDTVSQLHRLGVEVINCSPDSAITAYPCANIGSVLG